MAQNVELDEKSINQRRESKQWNTQNIPILEL